MASRQPSRDLFVVRGASATRLEKLVRKDRRDVHVEPLAEEALVLRIDEEASDGKESWRRLQQAVGQDGLVAPVMVDDAGARSYPTGSVQVRFAAAPSDEELGRFAAANGLKLVKRNQYQPAQAMFSVGRPRRTYLPELVEKLAAQPGVRKAWPEAEAQYRR